MVNPIYIIILSLTLGFLLTVFDKASRKLSLTILFGLLTFNSVLMFGWLIQFVIYDQEAIIIHTSGFVAPLSINLQLGFLEAFLLSLINLTGLLSAVYLLKKFLETHISGLILYLLLIMGVNGLIMTRDIFNLFVFLEIVSISTYALISIDQNKKSYSAGFKYMIAGGITSTFFLLGVIFIYYFTGNLNLDSILACKSVLATQLGVFSVFVLLISVFIELKPFPANGWALDVYQAANSGVASVIAVVNSAAILFVFYKLLPLLPLEYLSVFIGAGIVTFFFSNLIGIKQTDPKRLLGYSSISQMGLIVATISYSMQLGLPQKIVFIISGGLFLNHFLAKAGLFWISGIINKEKISDWSILRQNRTLLILFGILLFALAGLPPFSGFWAKWEMVKVLVSNHLYLGLTLVLLGSLFEAFYLFRWLGYALKNEDNEKATDIVLEIPKIIPIMIFAFLSFLSAFWIMNKIYTLQIVNYLPILTLLIMYLLRFLPLKIRAFISIGLIATYGYHLYPLDSYLQTLFAIIFVIGSCILMVSTMNRKTKKDGFYGYLLMLVFSMGNLIIAKSLLSFFLNWEFMTIAAYLLIAKGKRGKIPALTFMTFSLAGAYLMLAGFGFIPNISGYDSIVNSIGMIPIPLSAMILLLSGFLIKSAAFGVHIWIPGAYAEVDDDVSPFFASVFSKTGILGILLIAIVYLNNSTDFNPFYWLGWLGAISAIVGAFLATFQEDVKKLMAYSSMSQLGYIVSSISLLSHLGWVSALYLTINHFMFKAMIFIAIAGVIYRTQTRQMYKMGGLIKKMPISYITVLIGIIAVSGVPPLSGFGSKWLLYTSLIEKGWYLQAAVFFFASAVSFLYLYRLIHTIFLGQLKFEHQNIKEAPIWYLIPQFIFIAGIMAISVFPNLIINPLNTLVSNYLNSDVIIDGYKVTSSLGYWNGNMIMMVTMGVFVIPLILLIWFNGRTQKVKQFNIVFAGERPESPQTTHFAYNMFSHYHKALGDFTKPRILDFWNSVSEWSHSLASMFRQIYTGNGQTYLLHIILYIIVMYIILGV